ncbi:MAG: hypothetical protein HWD61_15880 [Parachlamydiaceae bacterium]|nr:MAG: hypothetical protein HWD61_15880 [Parachlamydiaceae bacterium]
MAFHHHKDLKYILHPYIFVLKENKGIQKDLFDYSLWMMRVGSPETIRSPESLNDNVGIFVDEFDVIRANLNA